MACQEPIDILFQARLLTSCELHLIRELPHYVHLWCANIKCICRIITLTANDVIIGLYKRLRQGAVA